MCHPDHLDFMRHHDQFGNGYASDGGFIGEATESWRLWALHELPFYGVDLPLFAYELHRTGPGEHDFGTFKVRRRNCEVLYDVACKNCGVLYDVTVHTFQQEMKKKKTASKIFAKSELPFWDAGGVELPFWEMQRKLLSLKGERMHPWARKLPVNAPSRTDAPITHKVTSGCTLLDWMHPPATWMHPEFEKGRHGCTLMAVEGKYGCIQTLVDTSFFNVRMHPQDVWIVIFWGEKAALSTSKLGKLGSGFFLAEPQLGHGSHHSSATY
ncbi:hypothetical protein B0H16DRAFT_1485646 [Mycena metata]|uniref:Uncharacterized protein n=1 Tax=Mycena metata TaxID=1033252 RepID=A0AAD7DNM2_9AGAR|nr:hypothetical protein B0H16DRAFT_1485646 [Mycena metata]